MPKFKHCGKAVRSAVVVCEECNGWVSVEDRLPESGVPVLVIVSGRPHKNIELVDAYEFAEHDDSGWILQMYPAYKRAQVSYWRHLPEPPGREQNG